MTKMTTVAKVLVSGGVLCAAFAAAPSANAAPRTHDGFFLQGDVGVGYLSSSYSQGGSKLTYSGVTLPSELLLGGTVGPVVIGGGLFGDYAPSPSATIDAPGYSSSSKLDGVKFTYLGMVLFADIYPDVHGGMHFEPFVGWSDLSATYKGYSSSNDPNGLVVGLAGGYNWWVSDQWSIGVLGRFAYAPLKLTYGSQSETFNTIAPAIMASFTYH